MFKSFIKIFSKKKTKYFFQFSDKKSKPKLISFSLFFMLMLSFSILRPLRSEIGLQCGVDQMHWLLTGSFLGFLICFPVLGYFISKFSIVSFFKSFYVFLILNLLFLVHQNQNMLLII